MVADSDAIALEELVLAQRQAFFPRSDTQIRSRAGWLQLVTPSLPDGGLNDVVYCELTSYEADRVIDETLAEYERLGLRMRWYVLPGSLPDDLPQRLEQRGLQRKLVCGMARTLSSKDRTPNSPNVELVTAATVDEFTGVFTRGWQVKPQALLEYHRALVENTERPMRLFIVRHEGVAAGAASYALLERSAFFIGGVVLPEFRGRGYYRALVNARMNDALAHWRTLAITHAHHDTSAPILARLGFREMLRFPVFINR